jgi:hypothetical protein
LRDVPVRDGTGDPGRMIGEGKKKARDLRREAFLVVLAGLVLSTIPRKPAPASTSNAQHDGKKFGSRPKMAVPLPLAITYRARMLLMDKDGTSESRFWWMVVEAGSARVHGDGGKKPSKRGRYE